MRARDNYEVPRMGSVLWRMRSKLKIGKLQGKDEDGLYKRSVPLKLKSVSLRTPGGHASNDAATLQRINILAGVLAFTADNKRKPSLIQGERNCRKCVVAVRELLDANSVFSVLLLKHRNCLFYF